MYICSVSCPYLGNAGLVPSKALITPFFFWIINQHVGCPYCITLVFFPPQAETCLCAFLRFCWVNVVLAMVADHLSSSSGPQRWHPAKATVRGEWGLRVRPHRHRGRIGRPGLLKGEGLPDSASQTKHNYRCCGPWRKALVYHGLCLKALLAVQSLLPLSLFPQFLSKRIGGEDPRFPSNLLL